MMQTRPLRPFEQGAHLHVLDWAHQTARYRFMAAGHAQVHAAAASFAHARTQRPPQLPALAAALTGELRGLYALGHQTVRSELEHQRSGEGLPVGLSAPTMLALPDADPGSLADRGRLAAQAVSHAVWQAVARGALSRAAGQTRLRRLGESAGHAELRSQASLHAGAALNAGRHEAAIRTEVIGARYTSVLDKNTCAACALADDGVLRSLEDPALVHPPNPDCSGGERCRCILVYQLASETGTPLLPSPGTVLPIAAGA